MPAGLVTADEVCHAVQRAAAAHLPAWQHALDLPTPIRVWQQLPQPTASPTTSLPYALVTTPGLATPPIQKGGDYWATWRVVVGVFDRGATHDGTASVIRRWAAAVRASVLASPGLGIGAAVTWVAEEYSLAPDRDQARTLGGCITAFDVAIARTTPLVPPPLPGDPSDPRVITTAATTQVELPTAPLE